MCLKEIREGGGRFECLMRENQVSAFIHHSSNAILCLKGGIHLQVRNMYSEYLCVCLALGHAGMKKGFAMQQILSENAGYCSCQECSRHPDMEQVWVEKKFGSWSSELMVNSGVFWSFKFTSVNPWNISVPGHPLCASVFGLLLQCPVFIYNNIHWTSKTNK